MVGSWQTGSYEKDGVKVYTNTMAVSRVEFVGSGNANSGQTNDQNAATSNVPEAQPVETPPVADADGFFEIDDDELPFS